MTFATDKMRAMRHVDPTAGVTLYRKASWVACPRCGVEHVVETHRLRGRVCPDCKDVLTPAERAAWRRAGR